MFFEKLKKKHKVSDYIEKHGVHPATALIVSPKSTLENWAKEFDMWIKKHNLQNIKNKKKGNFPAKIYCLYFSSNFSRFRMIIYLLFPDF